MDADKQVAEGRVGSTLRGKYQLERLLGVGGMAAVYRGVHRNGNRVAVKMLHPTLSHVADIRDRFLREGYVANKVEHRGAVRVLDDDVTDDGAVFLVMELLEGETLDARAQRQATRRLSPREVAELGVQLLDVLAAAHDVGIVHRDIKPENLFLTSEGVLKVLDFGIARLRDPSAVGTSSATRTGRMLGTPAFMAPEQVLGRSRAIDGQTDLWSAGATFFTLMSGHFVHEAETAEEMMVYAGSRPARPLASVAPDVPGPLLAVVDRALTFDKESRWSNARAMRAALADALQSAYGVTTTGPASRSGSLPDAMAATTASDAQLRAAPGAGTDPTLGAPAALAASLQAPTPAPVWRAASTTGGLSDPSTGSPHAPQNKQTLAVIAAAVAVLLLGGLTLVLLLVHKNGAASAAAMAPSTTVPVVITSAPPPVTPPVPDPTPSASAAPSVASAEAKPLPPTVVPRGAGAGRSGRPVGGATHASCDPPYTIDAAGRRVPKPECL